ncbi:unnamed protein product [Sphagnum jensenii]|uniref:Uncharacterized protein n=1 Tax=Sphagnum jensenii TaxID=128206 RepID=A0ABP0W910_9BRYO
MGRESVKRNASMGPPTTIQAYILAGFAVQQFTISNLLSIIIPVSVGCFLYIFFVGLLLVDSVVFFGSAGSGSIVDFFLTDLPTMIWNFLSLRSSSCTQERCKKLAERLVETARLGKVQQLFNTASDDINCYDPNIPAASSATRNNTPHKLNAEQTSQQQQHWSTETSNNAAGAADLRAPQSADNNNAPASSSTAFRQPTSPAAVLVDKEAAEEEEEEEEEGHGPDAEADLHDPVANSRIKT